LRGHTGRLLIMSLAGWHQCDPDRVSYRLYPTLAGLAYLEQRLCAQERRTPTVIRWICNHGPGVESSRGSSPAHRARVRSGIPRTECVPVLEKAVPVHDRRAHVRILFRRGRSAARGWRYARLCRSHTGL